MQRRGDGAIRRQPGGVCSLEPIMLDMKPRCERCDAILPDEELAFICSYECTFCSNCARWFQSRCPNCAGELVRRPRRGVVAEAVAVPMI